MDFVLILVIAPLTIVHMKLGWYGWLIPPALAGVAWFLLGLWNVQAQIRRRWSQALLVAPVVYALGCVSLSWSTNMIYRRWLDGVSKRACDLRVGMSAAEVDTQIRRCTRISGTTENGYVAIAPPLSSLRNWDILMNFPLICRITPKFNADGKLAEFQTSCWD